MKLERGELKKAYQWSADNRIHHGSNQKKIKKEKKKPPNKQQKKH